MTSGNRSDKEKPEGNLNTNFLLNNPALDSPSTCRLSLQLYHFECLLFPYPVPPSPVSRPHSADSEKRAPEDPCGG